jgi:hypothetical protein
MSTDVSEVHAAFIIAAIALMVEAARISETSVDIYFTTRRYIPEDSELQTRTLTTVHRLVTKLGIEDVCL